MSLPPVGSVVSLRSRELRNVQAKVLRYVGDIVELAFFDAMYHNAKGRRELKLDAFRECFVGLVRT